MPVALAGAGAILMLRPVLPAVRPFRSGAICLFLAVTLGLSAGTLGPGGARPDWWDAEWVKTRGGMMGETLDWVVDDAAGHVGAHILAVFLFLAGVLLLTGASVAGVIKATSDSVSTTTRELRGAVKTAPRAEARAARRSTTWRRSSSSTRVRVERPDDRGRAERVDEPPEFDGARGTTEPRARAPGALDAGARGRAEPEPVAELDRLAEDPAEDEPGVTRGPAEPVDPRSSSRRRAATAATSPTRPTSSGSCRTRPSSRARPRTPRGRTRPGRRRSPRS